MLSCQENKSALEKWDRKIKGKWTPTNYINTVQVNYYRFANTALSLLTKNWTTKIGSAEQDLFYFLDFFFTQRHTLHFIVQNDRKKWEWDERNGKKKKLKAPTIIFDWRCLLLYFINVSKLKHLIALAPLKSLKMRSVIFVNVFHFFQLVPLHHHRCMWTESRKQKMHIS